jgi:hypothetical protein
MAVSTTSRTARNSSELTSLPSSSEYSAHPSVQADRPAAAEHPEFRQALELLSYADLHVMSGHALSASGDA